ncbi:MAG: UvrD-helicase domain-containing protein, partial [Lachnospiraceae bacterium]|nr:UvrD-helicase domain-containing protein [Lachnospiraceae bacterium]
MGEIRYSEEQLRVINTRKKNILVSAAAGSGKTTVLVKRIIEKITDENNPVDIDRILVLTYTDAAASEMRSRIEDAIENALLEKPYDEQLN